MNAPLIATGGEPAQKIVQLSDADMARVKSLVDAGFGAPELPDNAHAILTSNRRSRVETRQARYQRFAEAARAALESDDPRAKQEVDRANAALASIRNLGSTAVHTDSSLASFSLQYANDEYIGEDLCPPVLTEKKSDTYYIYDERQRFAGADDASGDDNDAVEVIDKRSTSSYECKVRAYKRRLSALTLANQDAPLNEMIDLVEQLAELRALKREIRIADVLTTAGNYATANKTTLAGANQWNSASGGNPIKDLQAADAALWRGRGPMKSLAFSDLDNYHILSRHPDVLGLFQYNGSSPGLATPDMIARFLGWDDYLVGRARKDTANEGAAASYARIWGDFFGVVRVPVTPRPRSAAFALTFRWSMPGVAGAMKGIVTKQWFDQTKGLGGSYFAESGEAEDHKVVSDKCGYLISDVRA